MMMAEWNKVIKMFVIIFEQNTIMDILNRLS